jgi:DNA-binding NarL/FixJ family response regulator
LWGTPLPDEDRTVESIRKALRSNPEINSLLGEDCPDLPAAALYARLNGRLDRYEFDPSSWIWKVKDLAEWTRAEARALPGRRRRGKISQWHIRVAVDLAANGARQSQIAEKLGIRSSTISNWVKRGQAPELKRLFATHRLNRNSSEI